MAQSDPVLFGVDNRVALITINDPDRRNALTGESSAQLRAAVERAEADPEVHAVVVTGAGRGIGRAVAELLAARGSDVILLARSLPVDGLFAACDLIALGAMRALREHGLHVPRDVAVIGFDGISSAAYATPPLTTVAQDTTGAGELLVAALMAQIRGEPVQQMMLAPTLVVRESSGIEADG